jgi:hypothetical protein
MVHPASSRQLTIRSLTGLSGSVDPPSLDFSKEGATTRGEGHNEGRKEKGDSSLSTKRELLVLHGFSSISGGEAARS